MPTKKTTKKPVAKKVTKKTATKKVATKKPVKKAVNKKIVKKAVSKKTTKKPAVKKSSTKKSLAKKTVKKSIKKPLVYAGDNTSFWVTDGQVLNSLVALRDALDNMEKEVYSYHAGEMQNDFSNWVSEVLADDACATDLIKAKTPKKAKTTVVKHLKYYSV